MKICVYGAGAVGGNIAARLMTGGAAKVSVVTRGAHLAAIRERGLVLRTGGDELSGRPVAATDDASTLPPQDMVIVTLKAHSIPSQAGAIARLLAPGAPAVFAINGIPWWWRHGLQGRQEGAGQAQVTQGQVTKGQVTKVQVTKGHLPLLDPEGALWSKLGPDKAVGCVVNSANEVIEPGVVLHKAHNLWQIGEPDGSDSARRRTVIAAFRAGGLDAVASPDIRRDVLYKLALNAANSPLSALTRLGTNATSMDDDLRAMKAGLLGEIVALAGALHLDLSELDAGKVAPNGTGPGSRPSMLQDVRAGRAMEVEALLGQPQALAREAGVATPILDVIVALARGLNRSLLPT
jgi:2-dehydropantoate 2-reductase